MNGLRSIGGASIGSLAGRGSQARSFYIPIADVNRGAWVATFGTSLFEVLNEEAPDDTSYAQSPTNPTASPFTVLIQEAQDPGVHYGHVLKYRFKKTGNGNADITVKLLCGATTISTYTHSNVSSSFTLAEQTLTDAEAGNITDYSDLRVEVTASKA